MIVEACAGCANLTNVYVLNSTAAFLWSSVEDIDFDAAMLVDLLCGRYDVDRDRAACDVAALLGQWREYRMTVES